MEIDTSICLQCKKAFKNLLLHLNKIPNCKAHYTQEAMDELVKKCKEITKEKLKQKRRMNYNPKAESDTNRQTYMKRQKLKKESMSTFKEENFIPFFQEIQYGPVFPCICCMKCFTKRGVKVLNPTYLENLRAKKMLYYIDTSEKLRFLGNFHLCHTCDRKLPKEQMPKLCFRNGLELSEVPKCLQLSSLGNQLLAKYILFIKLRETSKRCMDRMNDRVSVQIANSSMTIKLKQCVYFPGN